MGTRLPGGGAPSSTGEAVFPWDASESTRAGARKTTKVWTLGPEIRGMTSEKQPSLKQQGRTGKPDTAVSFRPLRLEHGDGASPPPEQGEDKAVVQSELKFPPVPHAALIHNPSNSAGSIHIFQCFKCIGQNYPKPSSVSTWARLPKDNPARLPHPFRGILASH